MNAVPAQDWTAQDGQARLGPRAVAAVDALDGLIAGWARTSGAEQRRYPAALPARGLDAMDYFHNFPHLAAPVSALSEPARARCAESGLPEGSVPAGDLTAAGYLLPSAACYAVFLDLHGQRVAAPALVTTRASCFRSESEYDDLRRLWNFQMREIVYLGTADGAQDHIAHYSDRIPRLAKRLGLAMAVHPATDPFYRRDTSRALLQRLEPVKWEFVVDDCAIASVNLHRNFFGDRCAITGADGRALFSACVAFGLERWLHVLHRAHGGDLDAVREALERLSAEPET